MSILLNFICQVPELGRRIDRLEFGKLGYLGSTKYISIDPLFFTWIFPLGIQ